MRAETRVTFQIPWLARTDGVCGIHGHVLASVDLCVHFLHTQRQRLICPVLAHDAGHAGVTGDWWTDKVVGIIVANWIGGLSLGWWCDVSPYPISKTKLIAIRTITRIIVRLLR